MGLRSFPGYLLARLQHVVSVCTYLIQMHLDAR